jgi:hypothetical protein
VGAGRADTYLEQLKNTDCHGLLLGVRQINLSVLVYLFIDSVTFSESGRGELRLDLVYWGGSEWYRIYEEVLQGACLLKTVQFAASSIHWTLNEALSELIFKENQLRIVAIHFA